MYIQFARAITNKAVSCTKTPVSGVMKFTFFAHRYSVLNLSFYAY